jgi:hypothetical protein
MGNFIIQHQLEKPRKICCPEGNIADPRNTRMEGNSKNPQSNGGPY